MAPNSTLAGARAAGNQHALPQADANLEELLDRLREAAEADQVVQRERLAGKLADRQVDAGPGGRNTAWTREPSGSRASSTGCSSLISRPTHWATLWIADKSASSLWNRSSVCSSLPLPLDVHVIEALTMISLTDSSLNRWRDRLEKVLDGGFEDLFA